MGVVESVYAEIKQQELNKSPYGCLESAEIDINPHQIEAFMFALSAIPLGGAILYSVGTLFFLMYAMFGIPILVLGFVGYSKQKKLNRA